MTSRKLEIKYVPIDAVKPWDKNPKKHNKKAILESIKRFKPTQPILVQKGTGLIIAGHGRLEAFKELGYAEVPIIELEMNDAEARAYALVDNQTVIAGGWDDDLLLTTIQELKVEIPELDLGDFGFKDKQMGKEKEEKGLDFVPLFQIVIDCEDEEEQQRIYNELTELGYSCKPLTL